MKPSLFENLRLLPRPGTHCIGNGRQAGYFRGADILQLFGPCYSVGAFFSLTLREKDAECADSRLAGTGLWRSDISLGGAAAGHLVDAMHPERPIFLRRFHLERPLCFEFKTEYEDTRDVFGTAPSILMRMPVGSYIFAACRLDKELLGELLFSPNVVVDGTSVFFPAGDSWVAFASAPTLEACVAEVDAFRAMDMDAFLQSAADAWGVELGRMRDMSPLLQGRPDAERIAETIEDVAVALLSQTSVDGGVLAGHPFHLAYGRDMYGDIRGFLALGLFDRARAAIEFHLRNWRTKGFLPNANGMGVVCSHCHECDDVEQTGYALLELHDYALATADIAFVRKAADFIRWLLDVQERLLVGGMLPFNGDETYIAGGLLPRNCIDHGSMEATALYIAGATRILALSRKHGILPEEEIRRHEVRLADARARFDANFRLPDGRLRTNNPERVKILGIPNLREFRHGVCVGCHAITDIRRTDEGGYLCAKCHGRKRAASGTMTHVLDAATLMTGFVHAEPVDPELPRAAARAAWAERTARSADLPVVGYEYGLQLYVLADSGFRTSDPENMLAALLALGTSAGVWSEYYRGGKVSEQNTQYRPWESAINLCGILRYLESWTPISRFE